ncbi:hypothetical protein NKG05_22970 [Oerskovia sp. M15]
MIHAIFLGFTISMIMAHAPVILPAVLRIRLPYTPLMYGPAALLHLGLVIRLGLGDAGTCPWLTRSAASSTSWPCSRSPCSWSRLGSARTSRPRHVPRPRPQRRLRPARPADPPAPDPTGTCPPGAGAAVGPAPSLLEETAP